MFKLPTQVTVNINVTIIENMMNDLINNNKNSDFVKVLLNGTVVDASNQIISFMSTLNVLAATSPVNS